MSWREIGALLLLSDKTTSVWVIEAFPALADWRRGHAWNVATVGAARGRPGEMCRAGGVRPVASASSDPSAAQAVQTHKRHADVAIGMDGTAPAALGGGRRGSRDRSRVTPAAVSAKAKREGLKPRYWRSRDRHPEPTEA